LASKPSERRKARETVEGKAPRRSVERHASLGAGLADRRRERELLCQKTEVLQTIFDNIPVMISQYDAAGRLLLVNREWERVVGWSLEEAQRIDLLAETYPDPVQRARVVEFIRQASRGWTEFKLRTRDGRMIDMSWFRVALSDGTSLGLGHDITASKRLQQSYQELRALSDRLREVREEESTRIAREVHDGVGQMLTALSLDVAWLEKRVQPLPPAARLDLTEKLSSIHGLLTATVDAVHRIVTELRPSVLDELGLEAAIETYVEEFQKRSGVICQMRSRGTGGNLDHDRSTALFRILQEALTNVARHACASEVRIGLSFGAKRIVLSVADNGRGIPQARIADSQSLGLLGMRERARALGGDVTIRRGSRGGTTIEATVPR
jgi:PAS domain S-box-containing protein